MLIHLIPPNGSSLIQYPVAFHDLPDTVSGPPAWTTQLNALSADDLELPGGIHAVDKAAFIPSIIDLLFFDLDTMTVTYQLVDGYVDRWALRDMRCIRQLEMVLSDVNIAMDDREKEIKKENEEREAKEAAKDKKRLSMPTISSPPPPKLGRHKRQKSFLGSCVVTVVSLLSAPFTGSSSSSSKTLSLSSASSLQPSPPPPTVVAAPSLSPHARRRRARSMLVDAFRRFVLPEVKCRISADSYYLWIAQSMLRRASDRLAELVQQAGGRSSNAVYRSRPSSKRHAFLPPRAYVFFEDDDLDAEDASTDTDGSSLHTPTSTTSSFNGLVSSGGKQMNCFPLVENDDDEEFNNHDQHLSRDAGASGATAGSRSQHDTVFSKETLQAYTVFSAMTLRLQEVINAENARLAHIESETQNYDVLVEVRSRRRAWLNRSLQGTPGGYYGDLRFSASFVRSSLGRFSWTAEELVSTDASDDDYDEATVSSPGVESYLFPVTEEDEDEFEMDLESGLRFRGGMEFEFGMDGDDDDHDHDGRSVAAALGDICIVRRRAHSGNLGIQNIASRPKVPPRAPSPPMLTTTVVESRNGSVKAYSEFDAANPFCLRSPRPQLQLSTQTIPDFDQLSLLDD